MLQEEGVGQFIETLNTTRNLRAASLTGDKTYGALLSRYGADSRGAAH
jgi:hypothetical protein